MIKGLEEFLTVFGDVTISDAVIFITAIVFAVLFYKRISKYLDGRAENKVKKKKEDEERDKKIQEAYDDTKKYKEYREKSIQIQEELKGSIEKLNDSLKEIAFEVDDTKLSIMRSQILDFASSLRRGEEHTNEDFLNIIDAHEKYENLIEKWGLKNGVISETFEYIMDVYHRLLNKGGEL